MSKKERAVFNLLWDMVNAVDDAMENHPNERGSRDRGSIISRYANMLDDRIENRGYSASVDSLKLYTVEQLENEIRSRDE